jgi:hypothetical protein
MILGILGCVFGILGILTFGFIFVPIAALCAVLGFITSIVGRNGPGFFVCLIAGLLTVIGYAVSPSLWLATAFIVGERQDRRAPATPPKEFAWRQGEPLPPMVTIQKNALLPDGYEMHSGVSHGCHFPECTWLVRTTDTEK